MHSDVLETVSRAMRRMRVFADAAWSKLRDHGYKPYTRAYKFYPGIDIRPYSVLGAGFFRPYVKGPLNESYVILLLGCADLKLCVEAAWVPKKIHPDFGDNRSQVLKEWSPRASKDFFQHPLNESLAKAMPDLQAALRAFRRTKFYKASI